MHYSIGMSGGGEGDGDAMGTGVQQQMAVDVQQSFVTVAHGSGSEDNDDDDWNRGVARQQQLHLQHNGVVVETSGAPGGGSGGDGEDGSGPLSGTFFGGDDGTVYGGFFALQLVCSITPNPSSQMLSAISSLFANRRPGSTIFLGTPVLSSMTSLPRIASTTDGSRVRGSGISCLVTASVCR